MKMLSIIKDDRIGATSVLLEMSIGNYLKLTDSTEGNLDIQRRIVKGFKPYERLRDDLKEGCLVPPVVIGIREGKIKTPDSISDNNFIKSLEQINSKDVFIVDGLQRTNAIRSVKESLEGEAEEEFLLRPLRVEVWPDITLSALIYRMILLNAGQKPMSLKHQLEVVNRPLCDSLQEKYKGRISIFREKDSSRRRSSGQYQFSVIAQAFQAFVQKKPQIDVRNQVVAELDQIDVLASYGESLSKKSDENDLTSEFEKYISFLLDFDEALCKKYQQQDSTEETSLPTGVNVLSRDTFHVGLAAAYGWCVENKKDALKEAEKKLFILLNDAGTDDPLALVRFEGIQKGFGRKDNVGEKTRDLVYNGFKEYFRSEGLEPFERCWTLG